MRAFPVRLPSGQRYWTVLDEDLEAVAVADGFWRHQRFGRDGAESTTKAYAHAIALLLRWCALSGRSRQAGVEHLGLFMTWLALARPQGSAAGPQGFSRRPPPGGLIGRACARGPTSTGPIVCQMPATPQPKGWP